MSERVGFRVTFDVPLGYDALRVAFAAIREAVADNWRDHRDRLSTPEPVCPVEIEHWVRNLQVNTFMELMADDLARHTGTARTIFYEPFTFSFSPVSSRPAQVHPVRVGDRLRIGIVAPERVFREDGGERVWQDGRDANGDYEADPVPADAPWYGDPDHDPSHYQAWAERWFAPYHVVVGPANRACLLSILDRLRLTFPVLDTHIAEGLEAEIEWKL